MFAVSPKLARSTGAAPGICEIITVPLSGEGEPRSVREGDNLGEIFSQAQELGQGFTAIDCLSYWALILEENSAHFNSP